MPSFTLPLWEVIELTGGTADIDPTTGIRKLVNGKIGLQYYPEWTPNYRDILNGKIVDHYWNYEIGHETIDLFQQQVRVKMQEIMPLYNQLYLSTRIEFDPLSTMDVHSVSTGDMTQHATNVATNNTTTEQANKSRSVASDTPQTQLSGDSDYATSAADVNGEVTGTVDANENSTGDTTASNNGTNVMTGYQGPASALLMQYRQSLMNIDLQVIDSLESLFMGVWDTGDSFTQSNAYLYGY
jgi:hypothetical protein